MPRLLVNDKCLKRNYSFLRRSFCNAGSGKSIKTWNSVVGLEIHAQIASDSKLFSAASTKFGKSANSCVSFFDCATPGTLPVLNKKCVEAGVITALALQCQINQISYFDRKHYFYADLPAGYQITQQRKPIAINGKLKFNVFTSVANKESYFKSSKLKQIQLEQDSGKTLNDESTKRSLIDLNRAGIPLMEFVFEPDLKDGEEAAALVKELILILQRLNTCSCKMDEGALRVDANVSINRPNESLGVRTEIKNIGSVRGVASAINYEIKRQIDLCERNIEIVNETRAWDVTSNKTISMRSKEDKQDYRFMPEPNLPPLHIHVDKELENTHNLVDATILKTQIPEMPQETRDRLQTDYGLSKIHSIILVNEPILFDLFMYLITCNKNRSPYIVFKTIFHELLGLLYKNNQDYDYVLEIRDEFGKLIDFLQSEKINLMVFNNVLKELVKNPTISSKEMIEKNNWFQISDEEELKKICQTLLDENPHLVEQYKNGKKKLYKYFLGQIVKKTNDTANMKKVDQIMKKLLQ
ncbi:glutamyl-tRNA(Gln) amidotransferase subunit B, mitochondrial [Trichogramma pretiosum]|uniref:glutamyl-tRNA(Gln) amidotransferase subunit B, mitochondrial n=1 Tax=Trichogramma pretiosum TaxID=7493 RepID=UPI0006C9C433|nr:glutamyl-tRNA(Gln) amidotransferase subunit B, mitochondrial [Trichogramma pretiosum]